MRLKKSKQGEYVVAGGGERECSFTCNISNFFPNWKNVTIIIGHSGLHGLIKVSCRLQKSKVWKIMLWKRQLFVLSLLLSIVLLLQKFFSSFSSKSFLIFMAKFWHLVARIQSEVPLSSAMLWASCNVWKYLFSFLLFFCEDTGIWPITKFSSCHYHKKASVSESTLGKNFRYFNCHHVDGWEETCCSLAQSS